MTGSAAALGAFLYQGFAAPVAIALTGILAIPALMLGSVAFYYVLNGRDPSEFDSFSLVSNLNQTGIFIGLSLSGMEQNKTLSCSNFYVSIWDNFFQDASKLNVWEEKKTGFYLLQNGLNFMNKNKMFEDSFNKNKDMCSSML